MTHKINTDICTSCDACEPVCPNAAIRVKSGIYTIDPKKCNDCESHFDDPQCVAICPVDDCITEA